MGTILQLRDELPKESALSKLLTICDIHHDLHLHELNDGALKMVCFQCPFSHVLGIDEELAVRRQLDEQHISKI